MEECHFFSVNIKYERIFFKYFPHLPILYNITLKLLIVASKFNPNTCHVFLPLIKSPLKIKISFTRKSRLKGRKNFEQNKTILPLKADVKMSNPNCEQASFIILDGTC